VKCQDKDLTLKSLLKSWRNWSGWLNSRDINPTIQLLFPCYWLLCMIRACQFFDVTVT